MNFKPCGKYAVQPFVEAICVLVCTLACTASIAVHAADKESVRNNGAVNTDSIYQLSVRLVDQAGHEFSLDRFRGSPLLVTMFYSNCQFVCPRIVASLKRTEGALPGAIRNKVPVLMVSFDIVRDDAAALRAMAGERHIDTNVWTLARSDAASTRKLAAILGVQYRELDSGEFNHTSVLILLDREGRIVGKSFDIGGLDAAFVKLVAKTAGGKLATR